MLTTLGEAPIAVYAAVRLEGGSLGVTSCLCDLGVVGGEGVGILVGVAGFSGLLSGVALLNGGEHPDLAALPSDAEQPDPTGDVLVIT